MINLYVQKLMMLGFSVWPVERAESFAKHMDPFLHQPRLTNWQVIHWAAKFKKSRLYDQYLAKKYIITDDMIEIAMQEIDDETKT